MIQPQRLEPARSAVPEVQPEEKLGNNVEQYDPGVAKAGYYHAIDVVARRMTCTVQSRIFGIVKVEVVDLLTIDSVRVSSDDTESELSKVKNDKRQQDITGQQHMP